MAPHLLRSGRLAAAVAIAVALLVPGGAASAATGAPCPPAPAFDDDLFSRPTVITNKFLPMTPGTRMTYEGTTAGGSHRVVFTVTDVTKKVAGVVTRVIHDVDIEDGEVIEEELAFFAQDDRGRVWNLGEYPEEFENGRFAGAPNTWLAGRQNARGGIHMLADPANPANRGREYLQGKAPAIDFLDCAKVAAVGGRVTVPAGTFSQVLTTHERSPLESATAIQTKEHAPGVGIVRIGAINDPEGETLVLTRYGALDYDARAAANRAACRLDAHGRATNTLYSGTTAAQRC